MRKPSESSISWEKGSPGYHRKKMPNYTFWMTKQMVENDDREVVLRTTLREVIFFLIFGMLTTIIAVGMVFPSMYYLTRVLREQFLEKQFSTVNEVEINFHDIHTAADFWSYCETILFDSFYWDYWYDSNDPVQNTTDDDKKVLYENKLMGAPRLRQLKVRNDSCPIHEYFRRSFITCYAEYSRQAEDTSSFGLGTGTAWTYSTVEKTGSISYWGTMASYDGGGYYQDLSADKNGTFNTIHTLKQNLWITRGTRVVFLDFTVYNANLNLFCVAKIVFEFPSTGGVLPSSSIHTVKLIRYVTAWDYFVMACEWLFMCFIFYYTLEEIREIIYFRWFYFKQFWNYVDLLIIILAYCCLITAIVRYVFVDRKLQEQLYNHGEYLNYEYVASWQVHYNNMFAVLIFLVYIKIFKYLSFNRTMSQLNNTLNKCAYDVLGFSIMFFIIFFAYAELGYLLFGTQVASFSSFGISMFTLLRTILGDFDYMELEAVNRILAPIFFLSYIFFVFFVLLNMFLAIINDTYADVKTEISLSPDEMQMSEFLKRGYYNFLRKCGCGRWVKPSAEQKNEYSVTIEKIRGVLKKCGFTDIEIEMFFARYNIDPTADISEYDISKLMSDLEGKQPSSKEGKGSKPSQGDDGTPLVAIDDFLAQQERLDQIEKVIGQLTNRVDALLKKLDTLENVRRISK